MLLGGVVVSWGAGRWVRRERGRALLSRLKWWGLTALGLASLVLAGGAVYWMVRRALRTGAGPEALPSPWTFLALGAVLGLPLSLPTVIAEWLEHRPSRVAERKRRGAETTEEERRTYADELLEQILEASPEPRDLEASVGGDEGRILEFRGELDADEGERLTHALRTNLQEHGFERVEGTRPDGGSWWTPV